MEQTKQASITGFEKGWQLLAPPPQPSLSPQTTPAPELAATAPPSPSPLISFPDALHALLDLTSQLRSITSAVQDVEQAAPRRLPSSDTARDGGSPVVDPIAALSQRLASKAASLPPVPPTPAKPPPAFIRDLSSPPPPVPAPRLAAAAPDVAKRLPAAASRLPCPNVLSRSLSRSQGTSNPQAGERKPLRPASGRGQASREAGVAAAADEHLGRSRKPTAPAAASDEPNTEATRQSKVSSRARAAPSREGNARLQRSLSKTDQRAPEPLQTDDDEQVGLFSPALLALGYSYRWDPFTRSTRRRQPSSLCFHQRLLALRGRQVGRRCRHPSHYPAPGPMMII
jgi:hypothetical protein